MLSHIKRLGKHTLNYASFPVFSKLVAFFLLPLYTRYLTLEDYGTVESMKVLASILFPVYGMGLGSAVLRFYFDYDSAEKKRHYLGSIRSFSILSAVVISALQLMFLRGFYEKVFPGIEFYPIMMLIIVGAALRVVATLSMSILRASEQSLRYVLVQAMELLTNVGVSILLVVGFKMGALGKIEANFAAVAMLLIFSYIFTRRFYRWSFDWSAIKASLVVGLPLVPHMVANWILGLSDRIIIQHFSSLADVGLYSVGAKLGSVVSIAVLAFNAAWAPFMFSLMKSGEKAKEEISRLTTYWAAGILFLAVGASLFSKEAVYLLTDEPYHSAYTIVPVIAFSGAFYGVYLMLSVQFFYVKQTKFLPFITGTIAVVNILLNFILIPDYGIMGASFATLISLIFYASLTYRYSMKVLPIPYEFKRLVILLVTALTCFFAGFFLPFGLWINLLLKIFIIIVFPVSLYFSGFMNIKEIEKIKSIFLSRVNREQ